VNTPSKSYQAYLFDLDGTLVDTAPDLGNALNVALTESGYPGVTQDQARNWIGLGAKHSLTQALAYHGLHLLPDTVEELLQRFLNFYADHVADQSVVYAGVIDTLDRLLDADKKTGGGNQQTHPVRFTATPRTELGRLFWLCGLRRYRKGTQTRSRSHRTLFTAVTGSWG